MLQNRVRLRERRFDTVGNPLGRRRYSGHSKRRSRYVNRASAAGNFDRYRQTVAGCGNGRCVGKGQRIEIERYRLGVIFTAHVDDGTRRQASRRSRNTNSLHPFRKPREISGGQHQASASLRIADQFVADLGASVQLPRDNQQGIAVEDPRRRVTEQAIRTVAIGCRRQEASLVPKVRSVLVAGIEHVECPVHQMIPRAVRQIAPDAVGLIRVEMPGKRPAGEKIRHERNRRDHHARRTNVLRPSPGRLLDPPNRTQLVAIEPARFKSDKDGVVEDVMIDQSLQQIQARPVSRPVIRSLIPIRLVTPAIPDRCVSEPRHTVLLAGAANKRIVHLTIWQRLCRLGADRCIDSFLQQVVTKVE